MDEWQPIETAPKDGHRILLAGRHGGIPWCHIGHWSPADGGFFDDMGASFAPPKYWMPLPAVPA